MVFQEFDLAAIPNKEIMIQYFRESLKSSVWAQLDAQGRDLDSWEDVIGKAINAKAKKVLKSVSNIREIDSKYLQGNKPAKKEKKNSGRAKFTNTPSADIPSGKQSSSIHQTSFVHLKKDQNRGPRRERGRGQGQDLLATGVNATPNREKRDLS